MGVKVVANYNINNHANIQHKELLKVIHSEFVAAKRNLLTGVAAEMNRGKTGIKYAGLPKRSSASGEGLANQSGDTLRSVRSVVRPKQLILGSNAKSIDVWEERDRPTLENPWNKEIPIVKKRIEKRTGGS